MYWSFVSGGTNLGNGFTPVLLTLIMTAWGWRHHHCTTTAPSLHHHCTITAPSPHHHRTITAPSLHHHCTRSGGEDDSPLGARTASPGSGKEMRR